MAKKNEPTPKQANVSHKLTPIDDREGFGHAKCGAGTFPLNGQRKRLCKRCYGL